MELTDQNIGNIFCLEPDGRLVQILDVTPKFVTYLTERGERFSSLQGLAGVVVQDNAAQARFQRNSRVGEVLSAAEIKAFAVLSKEMSRTEERSAASRVMRFAGEQRRYLDMKIGEEKEPVRDTSRSSLDLLIQRANAQREQGMNPAKSKSEQEISER